MTYLIIQIPAYNEEANIGAALDALPKSIPEIEKIEYLVINDGSSDDTASVAAAHGAHHVITLSQNRGLATAFSVGIAHALRLGADIIVNTDADNQYKAINIQDIIKPILHMKADIVVGVRPIMSIPEFSPFKKLLQRLGSFIVRKISGVAVEDAPSGFRALSRSAAKDIYIHDGYTYTLDMLIQAGQKDMKVVSVPIGVNPSVRKSKLVKSNISYVARSIFTMVRIFVIYRPFKFFCSLSLPLFFLALLLVGRFLYYYSVGLGAGFVQSLLIGVGFGIGGVVFLTAAVITDLIGANRRLIENLRHQNFEIIEKLSK